MNKKGLGKGLGAIFGDAADPVNTAVEPVRSDEEKKELLLKDIVPNPHQPEIGTETVANPSQNV